MVASSLIFRSFLIILIGTTEDKRGVLSAKEINLQNEMMLCNVFLGGNEKVNVSRVYEMHQMEDLNGDGNVQFNEFFLQMHRRARNVSMEYYKEVFDLLNLNSTGKGNYTIEEHIANFLKVDEDGNRDGNINMAECVEYLTKRFLNDQIDWKNSTDSTTL